MAKGLLAVESVVAVVGDEVVVAAEGSKKYVLVGGCMMVHTSPILPNI